MLFRLCIFWALAGVVAAEEPFRTVVAPVGPGNQPSNHHGDFLAHGRSS